MITLYKPLKQICALLALALLLTGIPLALAEGSFDAVVSVDAMKVYAQQKPHDVVMTLSRGTTVTVTAWSGNAALITYNGTTGIARVSDMTRADQTASPQPTTTPEAGRTMVTNRQTRVYRQPSKKSDYVTLQAGTTLTLLAVNGAYARVALNGRVGYMVYSHLSEPQATATDQPGDATVQTGNLPVITVQECQVYENADYSGSYVTLPKGAKLTLLAVRGDCAMVSRNGTIGYIPVACLKKDTGATGTVKDVNPFPTGSNEAIIYDFLMGDMGLNRAATMGVMANIYWESGYKPVIDGDGGTSYGICQWHAGRKTNLINWCTENGLDYNSLEGQLKFLQYELPTRYPSVNSYLRQVENTADGAYDAAYYFCFNFEAPANRTAQSTKRGNYARDTLWPK